MMHSEFEQDRTKKFFGQNLVKFAKFFPKFFFRPILLKFTVWPFFALNIDQKHFFRNRPKIGKICVMEWAIFDKNLKISQHFFKFTPA